MKKTKLEPKAVVQLLIQLIAENEQSEQDSLLERAEKAPAPNAKLTQGVLSYPFLT